MSDDSITEQLPPTETVGLPTTSFFNTESKKQTLQQRRDEMKTKNARFKYLGRSTNGADIYEVDGEKRAQNPRDRDAATADAGAPQIEEANWRELTPEEKSQFE